MSRLPGEEPSLPPLAPPWGSGPTPVRPSRKRGLDSFSFESSTSSDPATFSSDGLEEPSVDNYERAQRRKRRYVGAWFHPPKASSSALTRRGSFQRNFDSGVWMGSDVSSVSEAPPPSPEPARKVVARLPPPRKLSQAEENARAAIDLAIELSSELIDLSNLDLTEISGETIRKVSEFVIVPYVGKNVPFVARDPEIAIYLFSNHLTRVPSALFDLQYLTRLSLRGNRLEELPPCISQLKRLVLLNVAQNCLNYLPLEMLDLLNPESPLRQLYVHPNPFWQPESAAYELSGMSDLAVVANSRTKHEDTRFYRIFAHRTPVQFSDTSGRVWSDFCIANSSTLPVEDPDEIALPKADSKDATIRAHIDQLQVNLRQPPASGSRTIWMDGLNQEDDHKGNSAARPTGPVQSRPVPLTTKHTRFSKVPSLMELALRKTAKSARTGELDQILDSLRTFSEDGGKLHKLISEAATRAEDGLLSCQCGKSMVVPTTKWIEWHSVFSGIYPAEGGELSLKSLSDAEDERLVPFLGQGCSWKCLPQKQVSSSRPSLE